MGIFGSHTKETGTEKPSESNGKSIELLAELWSSWGYSGVKEQVYSLMKHMAKKGYEVNFTVDPLSGGNGEFYVYKVNGDSKSIVFSNNKSHKEAVYGNRINQLNMEDIAKKIEA